MQTYPSPVNFGVTLPHGLANALFNITDARSNAQLTAAIADNNPGHPFRVVSLTSYRRARTDTGEIPGGSHGPVHDWEEYDSTDGSRPLRVSRGGNVEIFLSFESVQPGARGRFVATLSIRGESAHGHWSPISTGLVALVANVRSIPPGAVQLVRGQTTAVPVTVISESEFDTTVSYRLEPRPDGISMLPLDVQLPHGETVDAQLKFAATANAQLGTQDIAISTAALEGQLNSFLDLPITVLPPRRTPEDECRDSTALSAPWARGGQVWNNFGITDSTETFLGYLPTPKLFRPTNAYEVSFAIQEAETTGHLIRALGSGWGFSDVVLPQKAPILGVERLIALIYEAAGKQGSIDEPTLRFVSQGFGHFFGYAIDTTTLNRSLQALLPDILAADQDIKGLFFVEAGMTLYDLNILLDSQPEKSRLALKTMGGATAQTIAGAISTGTHGGDFDRPPLADNVRALYLIGKGGEHHWIEPANPITERAKIRAAFPCIPDRNIHYDDDMFRAALVSMGAMGVIYAVILDVVPQYSLLQFNRWAIWEDFARAAIDWDPSAEYDTGNVCAVTLDNNGNAVEVHVGSGRLFYRVGRVDFGNRAIDWGPSTEYDTGDVCAVALDNNGNTLEVHVGSGRLFYRVGQVDFGNRAIDWGPSTEYDTGNLCAVALDNNGNAVGLHIGTGRLFYRVGRVDFGNRAIDWGASTRYDTGDHCAVALDNNGNTVEVHVGTGRLFYRVGEADFANRVIDWGPSTRYDTGSLSAVALDDDGNAVEVAVGTGRLFYRFGEVDFVNRAIVWDASTQYDTGNLCAVALDQNGNVVEVHVGTGRLFSRLGAVELGAEAGSDFADLFSGVFTGLSRYVEEQFPEERPGPNRFLQIVVNPIKTRSGKHTCFVTNRVELPLQQPSGVTPLGYGEVLAHFDWVTDAIRNSPDGNFWDEFKLGIHDALGDFNPKSDQFALARKLLAYCKDHNLPWVIRAIIELIMQKSFPSSGKWTSVWESMGGDWSVAPVLGTNPSGGLSVFMVGKDDKLHRFDEDGASGPWTLMSITMPGDDWPRDQYPVVVSNHSGGLSVFLVGKNGRLYRIDQNGADWDPQWTQMPGDDWPRDQPPIVANNNAGGLSVFLVGKNGLLYRIDQNGANWNPQWTQMPGDDWPRDQPPVVANNNAGGLSVFLVGKNGRLYRIDQKGANWDPQWIEMPGDDWPRDQPPVVAFNRNAGGLTVFLVGKNGKFYYIDQRGAVWDAQWSDMGGDDWPRDQPPVVADNRNAGGLSVFLAGKNGRLYRNDQAGADWDPNGWTDMGGPDWSREQPPVVAPNHSLGLSVFLVGKDLHNLFRFDQDGLTGAWTGPARMGGDWSQDHPVVIGGTPYVGQSIFLIAKDEQGFGIPLLSGIVGVLTAGLALEFLGAAGEVAGLAVDAAGGGAAYLGNYLQDKANGHPVLCRYDLSSPQIDSAYNVMAPAPTRPVRGFPILGGTAVEAAFHFPRPQPAPAGGRARFKIPDAIAFVQSVLNLFDNHVDHGVFPSGWISLRVTGRTDALLGMQQFDLTGTTEVVLIGNPDDYAAVQELERIAIERGGLLHWGQSNGLLTAQDVASQFGGNLAKWTDAQRTLGGDTFRNHFMDRCAL